MTKSKIESTVIDATSTETIAPISESVIDTIVMAPANPDRVIGTVSHGGITHRITERDAGKAASNVLRKMFLSHADAEMLAGAIENRLTSYTEIAELPARIVNVKIAQRKRGSLALIATVAAKKAVKADATQ